ncbi:MAG: hypothetical protein F6J92_41960 [Symploca sp. SIO1A3]|nr:hypothetical protein [Symploca sp. SIO1A3]
MFLEEITPILTELTRQPVAFLGGFFSGAFRLNLSDDPVKSWLDKQTGSTVSTSNSKESGNDNNSGPQSISID